MGYYVRIKKVDEDDVSVTYAIDKTIGLKGLVLYDKVNSCVIDWAWEFYDDPVGGTQWRVEAKLRKAAALGRGFPDELDWIS